MTWKRGGWLLGRDGMRPGWYGSWQNLNRGPTDAPKGSALRHGRAYVYPTAGSEMRLRAEWKLGRGAGLRLAVSVDSGDGEVLLSVGVGVAALYLGAEAPGLRRFLREALGMSRPSRAPAEAGRPVVMLGCEREVSLRAHDGRLWWRAWADPNELTSGTPRWRDGSLNLDRLLRGEERVLRTELERGEVWVPMPEGGYRATAVLEEVRIARPRWPDVVEYVVELDFGASGLPVPGKGENAWDCEDDAIFKSSAPARSFAEAVGALVGSVLAQRERRGGKDWRPPLRSAPAPAEVA